MADPLAGLPPDVLAALLASGRLPHAPVQHPAGVEVTPTPGFVLKTTMLGAFARPAAQRSGGGGAPASGSEAAALSPGSKLFINVCCAPEIAPFSRRPALEGEGGSGGGEEGITIPVSVGPVRAHTDAKGAPCGVVDCIVNPAVVADCAADGTGVYRAFLCDLALQYVEAKHGAPLNRAYKLPKLAYRAAAGDGGAVATQRVRVRPKAGVEEVGGKAVSPFALLAAAGMLSDFGVPGGKQVEMRIVPPDPGSLLHIHARGATADAPADGGEDGGKAAAVAKLMGTGRGGDASAAVVTPAESDGLLRAAATRPLAPQRPPTPAHVLAKLHEVAHDAAAAEGLVTVSAWRQRGSDLLAWACVPLPRPAKPTASGERLLSWRVEEVEGAGLSDAAGSGDAADVVQLALVAHLRQVVVVHGDAGAAAGAGSPADAGGASGGDGVSLAAFPDRLTPAHVHCTVSDGSDAATVVVTVPAYHVRLGEPSSAGGGGGRSARIDAPTAGVCAQSGTCRARWTPWRPVQRTRVPRWRVKLTHPRAWCKCACVCGGGR
jgi:hypothetical protein